MCMCDDGHSVFRAKKQYLYSKIWEFGANLGIWAVNSSFLASVAALSALVLSPLRAQQFGILCLTVCMMQLLGLISFDVT